MYYSQIHTQVRDDNPYLDEWVDYNLSLGFEHIIMVDHRSEEPVKAKWGDKVTVVREVRIDPNPMENVNVWMEKSKSYWLALLAVDQFIVLFKDRNINDLLAEFEPYGGLAINWSVYGSSGHVKRPKGLVKDNYLWRMPHDVRDTCQDLVQTIVNTQYCTYYHNDHNCRSTRDVVNEDLQKANTHISFSSRTRVKINHYITRSYEDWMFKVERARKAGVPHLYDEHGFHLVDDLCTVYDDVLENYGKPKPWDLIQGFFNFQTLYIDMVGKFDNAVFVEIGAYKGASTVFMADKIKKSKKNIEFFTVDIWEPYVLDGHVIEGVFYDEFAKNIEPVKDYVTPIKGNSHEVYRLFGDKSIDFVFIDGCHNYEHVKKDIQLWYPKLKDDGVFAGHDYTWGGVGRAVNEFADENSLVVKEIPNTSAWTLNKKK